MATVTASNPVGDYHDRPNKVLSVTRAEPVMIRYTDPAGKEKMALAYVFGEAVYNDLRDADKKPRRMAGVWIVANDSELREKLHKAPGEQALQILDRLEDLGIVRDGFLLGAPALARAAEPKDFSASFSDLGGGEEPAPAPASGTGEEG